MDDTVEALTVYDEWDGSTWSALGSGVGAPVYALGVYDDGGGEARR